MPGRSGTAALLGREREQAALYDALSLALTGQQQVVVVAGDGGAGKTALVGDLARRAEALGFTVAVGHCLDIDAGISFGPVIEAVTTLVAGIEDGDARPVARRMRAFLDPASPRNGEQRNLLEDLRLATLEAAASGPVLFVLEDLQWADGSTRDLAVALSRTARGRLLFVLSFRTDDLHRRHPARKALAEIARVEGGRRLDLGPLDRDSIAGIVAAVSGASPDPALVRSVLERSEGNPLYAEEIAAVGPGVMPDQLSDLFLARVDALAEGPRDLARTASVDGTRVDIDLLAQVADVDRAELNRFLRDLLEANVLRSVGGSLEFRHGLLREAVYDDLLPDERTQIHAELAAILQARADADPDPSLSALSRLAFHWSAAHDLPRTVVASVQAGRAAGKVRAAEAVAHFDRALSLWGRVRNAERLVGLTKVEVMVAAARSAREQGDSARWYALNRRAAEALEPSSPALVASRAYSALAFSALFFRDDMSEAQQAVGRSLGCAGDLPSEERAYALGAQALLHNFSHRFRAGLASADQAIADARAVASVHPLLLAIGFRSYALQFSGCISDACAALEQGIDIARTAGMVGHALEHSRWLGELLIAAGQVDRGMSVARSTYSEALAAGLTATAGVCGDPLVAALTWAGAFDSAESLLEEIDELGPPSAWRLRADLLLARGDLETLAELLHDASVDHIAAGPRPDQYAVYADLQLDVLRNQTPGHPEAVERYLNQLASGDSPMIAAAAARIAYHGLSLIASPPDAAMTRLRDRAAALLMQARAGLRDEWRGSYWGVQLALAEAYAARVDGRPGVDEFRAAAELAAPFGSYFALEPRLDLAQELLAHAGRDEGRELLVDCWTSARDMGARALERRASRLATRMRVPLPESASAEGPLSRLTPREREVLDRLATGASNRAIASELVISEKTVSVHVSNVLAKLGVANRGEAAALARDLVATLTG